MFDGGFSARPEAILCTKETVSRAIDEISASYCAACLKILSAWKQATADPSRFELLSAPVEHHLYLGHSPGVVRPLKASIPSAGSSNPTLYRRGAGLCVKDLLVFLLGQ
jgi:hypothetical protein